MATDFASNARAQKAIAQRNRTVRNLVLLGGVLVGVAGAFAWIVLLPADGPKPQDKFFTGFGLGLAGGFLVLAAAGRRLFPTQAACPSCGHDWDIKEGQFVPSSEQMPNWRTCPGCGARMRDA